MRGRPSITWALAWGAGTSTNFNSILLIIGVLAVGACSFSQKTNQNDGYENYEDDSENYEDFSLAGNEASAEKQAALDDAELDGRGLPHPPVATAAATRRLVMGSRRPPDGRLDICREEWLSLAEAAGTSKAILEQTEATRLTIQEDNKLYHWCFYYSVEYLDRQLSEGMAGIPIQTRMSFFTRSMKSLFIASRALDQEAGEARYFPYLRQRYIALSQAHFGRDLETIGPPLGNSNWKKPRRYTKPAGGFVGD